MSLFVYNLSQRPLQGIVMVSRYTLQVSKYRYTGEHTFILS